MALGGRCCSRSPSPGGALASDGLQEMADAGFRVNLVLMALNLLPIPPLDGGRIAVGLLPHSLAMRYARARALRVLVVIAAARDRRAERR